MPSLATIVSLILLLAPTAPLAAQEQRNERFYYPGSFNWQFLKRYNDAGRLFNAFDYGHAVLYEKLLTDPANVRRQLEEKEFNYLTTDLLRRPPRFAVAEEVIEPSYAKLAWRAKQMFDWAHVLHRQIYDVYADERLAPAAKDTLIEQLTDYYLAQAESAFLPVPKSMALMDEQYYSQVFRKGFPKFNGLIWAYHWLQVGLYEPLIEGRNPAEKKAGVDTTVARFWSMVEDSSRGFPRVMPMTSAIAPRFTAAHPRAAAIFDNLHMMHDIISDILAADTVPENRKRVVIYAALDEFQDSTRNVMTRDQWLHMADHMGGIGAMGGPATGPAVPAPPAGAPHEGHSPRHEGHAGPPPGDSAAVAATVGAFHRALESGDTAAVLELIASDAIVMEGGNLEDLGEYRSHHLPADMAFLKAVKIERKPTHVAVLGDAAWAWSTQVTTGKFKGRDVSGVGAELLVLSRGGAGWQVRAVHWSSGRLP
ncbi:MAG: YybH family protein [Gemmatimonadales bacterium]